MSPAIARTRLRNQLLVDSPAQSAREVVRTLGALQAQDYASALWTIGSRYRDARLMEVEAAIERGEIVRTWPLRGTLHFVPAEDAGWLLALCGRRVLPKMAKRRTQLAITDAMLAKSERALVKALSGGRRLTRSAATAVLRSAGVGVDEQRGYHVLCYLSIQGVLCFGPAQGKEQTFVLLDEWVKTPRALSGDEALATLATRYFASRAPATARDFGWWSGLPMADAHRGLALAHSKIDDSPPRATRSAHLLLGFDELLLGYQDRSAVLAPEHAARIVPGSNGMFLPTLVVEGRVVGTWKRSVQATRVRIALAPFEPLPERALMALSRAADRYGAFLGRAVELT